MLLTYIMLSVLQRNIIKMLNGLKIKNIFVIKNDYA